MMTSQSGELGIRARHAAAVAIAVAIWSGAGATARAEGPAIRYGRDIRPILADKCFHCHGPDEAARKAGLRLDTPGGAFDETPSGARPVVPGNLEESEIHWRITSDVETERMPPPDSIKSLTPSEVERLQAWIRQGARYEQHWAYAKPVRPDFPPVEGAEWPANPIDRFVLARLEGAGLKPSPPAEPAVLLRRLALDLTGLPPSVEEVEDFEADPSPGNYERQVDRLLASPRFGEKWARSWLDLARYADSNGYQHDDMRSIWPYRDWVIRALNADMPYDRFTVEQLAGDLLPDPTVDQLVATGFHRNAAANLSGDIPVEEVRTSIVLDRVNTTGLVWLGATLGCAQCHDHKFDPITQRDYFEMVAYFNGGVQEVARHPSGKKRLIGREVEVPVDGPRMRRADEIRREIAEERAKLEELKPVAEADQDGWEVRFKREQRAGTIPFHKFPWNRRGGANKLRVPKEQRSEQDMRHIRHLLYYDHESTGPHAKRIMELEEELGRVGPPTTLVMQDADAPRATHIFLRGSYLTPGEEVACGVPDALHPLDPALTKDRLGLARWLVDPDNPLVARVAVNRWWAELFGRGIVATPEDFGMQGEPPSHPELLDWLALEFVESGWSMKHVLRAIVTSATYRQSSRMTPELAELDPANRLHARGPRVRLPAELVRDNALAVAGLLSPELFGPPVHPPQPEGLWEEIPGVDNPRYPTSGDRDRFRRGLYTVLRRGQPYPSFVNFDATNRATCQADRARTNTPLQALTLLNDPAFVEAAEAFAARIASWDGPPEDRAIRAFRTTLARSPSEEELETLLALYREHRSWFHAAQVLLNLDEAITKS